MQFYQIVASGYRSLTGEHLKSYSRNIFRTYGEAVEHIPDFIERCCTKMSQYDLSYMDRKDIRTNIIELELKT